MAAGVALFCLLFTIASKFVPVMNVSEMAETPKTEPSELFKAEESLL
jgi:hypothetical protein